MDLFDTVEAAYSLYHLVYPLCANTKNTLRVSHTYCNGLYEHEQLGFPQEYLFDMLKFIVYKTAPPVDRNSTGPTPSVWAVLGPAPTIDYTSLYFTQQNFTNVILNAMHTFKGCCSPHVGPKRPFFDLFQINEDGVICNTNTRKREYWEGDKERDIQRIKSHIRSTGTKNDNDE